MATEENKTHSAPTGFFKEDADLIAQRVSNGAFNPVPRGMIDGLAPEAFDHKKKKVMLVLPNHRWATSDEYYTMWIIHPTQICLLAAQIEDKYQVVIVDCIIDDISEEEFKKIVQKEKPDVVGFSNFTHEYSRAGHRAVEIVKSVNSSIVTIMGGVYVITSPELAMENKLLDYAIIGEGEFLFQELLSYLHEGKPRPQKGLAFREKNGEVVIQERADFIQELSSLKYPAYHLVDFLKYATRYQRETTGRPRALPFARVCMTRGCPVGCTFCTVESITGGPIRYRSAEHMYGELEMLKKKYGVKFFNWDDDNLVMKKWKAEELFKLMIERNLDVGWLCEGTAIFCIDEQTIDLMARSGCKYLNVAIESGSPRVLKEVIKKPINFPRTAQLLEKMKSVGIEIASNFVIGNPGETWEEVFETINYAEQINIDYVKFFISTPFPKTKMFNTAKELGYLDDTIKFDEHQWSFGSFNGADWRAEDITIIRAYEWDRINFARPEKRKKVMEMMDITPKRLEEIRKITKENANPTRFSKKDEETSLKMNRYLTTKEKSVEKAKEETWV